MKKMKSAKKIKKDEDELAKLVKLTKLLKRDNVSIAPSVTLRAVNKWRNKDPKFTPKVQASENLVEGGGMQVDPSLKNEYDQWRQDKIAEQNERRAMNLRRFEAKKKARQLAMNPTPPPTEPKPE